MLTTRDLIRIRYIIWKVRARCWLVERLMARAGRLARPECARRWPLTCWGQITGCASTRRLRQSVGSPAQRSQLALQSSKISTVGQCQGCQSGGKRKLRRISVDKFEPLETAHVNEAQLRSVGDVVD